MPGAKRITIVGSGVSGAATFINLVEELKKNPGVIIKQGLIIDLMDQNPDLGPGFPYALDSNPILTINDNARALSLDKNNPLEYVQWLYKNKHLAAQFNVQVEKNEKGEITLNNYWPSRALFGMYCKERLEQAISEAENLGVKVNKKSNTTVTKMVPVADGWQITYKTQGQENSYTVKANQVALTVGHLPQHNYTSLKQHPGYFDSPFPAANLAQIPSQEPVVVLGKRLTGVDTAKILSKQHEGPIYVVSPSFDPFPNIKNPVRTDVEPYNLKYLSPEVLATKEKWTLDEMVDLFCQEVSHCLSLKNKFDLKRYMAQWRAEDPKVWLKQQMDFHKSGYYRKQFLMTDEIYYKILPILVKKLSAEDLQTFFKEYYGPFQASAAAMPYRNAEIVFSLMEKGQLKVYGGLEKVEYDGTHFVISFKGNCHEKIRVKYVVNAIGDGRDLQQHPLLKQLYDAGWITSDVLGGVAVNPDTQQVLNRNQQPYNNLYATGPLTFATNIAVHSVETATYFSANIATNMVQQLQPSNLFVNQTRGFWNKQNASTGDNLQNSSVTNTHLLNSSNQCPPQAKLPEAKL